LTLKVVNNDLKPLNFGNATA